jgi:hemolysin activation/secretion protein
MKRLFCLLVMFLSYDAFAQQAKLVGPADPSRVGQDLKDKKLLQVPESKVALPASNAEKVLNAPANSDKIKFVLKSLKIKGVESLDKAIVKNIYEDKIGKEVNLLEIYEIADKITQAYASEGYVFSRAIIPAQEIDKGNVIIKVVEGKIGKVTLEGDIPNKQFLDTAIDRISNEKPLRIYDLEKQVLLLNDLAGVKFRSVLTPSGKEGVVDLVLVAEKVSYENQIYVNNYGSKYIGPLQGAVKLGLNHSYVLPYNQTEFAYIASKDSRELKFFELEHSLPLNTLGTKLSLKASNSKARPGFTQKSSNIDGRTNAYDAIISQSIIRSRSQNLSTSLGTNVKDNKTDLSKTPFIREKIRSVRLSATYDRVDDFRGINVVNVTYTQGLKFFGASKRNAPNLSRGKGRPDFKKYEGSLSRYQALPYDLSAIGVLTGQFADNPLLSSEEFGFGGSTFGRAYDSSEILGDKGFAGMLELRYGGIPDLYGTQIQPFIFYDFGRVWNIDAGQEKFVNAASGGIGFRIDHKIGIFGVFTIAQPMDKRQSTPLHSKKGDEPRYGFQIGLKF